MNPLRYFCLNCKVKTPCKCTEQEEYWIRISDKLRPPKVDKKVKFRQFLDACPTFVNCVEPHQRFYFIELLREVKYFGKEINGRKWTNIKK